jgi:hypothetical protein
MSTLFFLPQPPALSLHREGQRQFARKHAQTSEPTPDRNRGQTTPRVVKARQRASPGQVA